MLADCSVIITQFNKPVEQLTECINSIKNQTISPKEIILVDDGSKEQHAHADAISIILPKNVGVAKARDIGVRMSTGKLILFVDADDKLAPDFIQQCGKAIAKGADIAYPNMLLFGEVERNKLVTSKANITAKYLLGTKIYLPVTSMMWRKVYDLIGGFRELPIFEDWDFWLRAFAAGFKFKRANSLLYYRQNRGSRNGASSEIKCSVHRQITAPFGIKNGQLERNPEWEQRD